MANCIAECHGYDQGREKSDSRVGSVAAKGTAATWKTRATAYVRADGSGFVRVEDIHSGKIIYSHAFGPESER